MGTVGQQQQRAQFQPLISCQDTALAVLQVSQQQAAVPAGPGPTADTAQRCPWLHPKRQQARFYLHPRGAQYQEAALQHLQSHTGAAAPTCSSKRAAAAARPAAAVAVTEDCILHSLTCLSRVAASHRMCSQLLLPACWTTEPVPQQQQRHAGRSYLSADVQCVQPHTGSLSSMHIANLHRQRTCMCPCMCVCTAGAEAPVLPVAACWNCPDWNCFQSAAASAACELSWLLYLNGCMHACTLFTCRQDRRGDQAVVRLSWQLSADCARRSPRRVSRVSDDR